MPSYTEHVALVKPVSTEKYDISVTNMNMDLIDSALNRIDKKNENQDSLLATKEELKSHVNDKENPHKVTQSQVGLSNVDNTSDMDKPVSDAQRNAINESVAVESQRAIDAEQNMLEIINTNKPIWDDKYTKSEVDNKFSTLETNIDWKEAVDTFNDIENEYPEPEDGWTVNTKDTNYTYRYNGESWIPISANAIPKATNELDGLLSKEDHIKYDSAEKNVIVGIQQNGIDVDIADDRKVNIVVPTKISELENDKEFITKSGGIYCSSDEPNETANGMLWIDESENNVDIDPIPKSNLAMDGE